MEFNFLNLRSGNCASRRLLHLWRRRGEEFDAVAVPCAPPTPSRVRGGADPRAFPRLCMNWRPGTAAALPRALWRRGIAERSAPRPTRSERQRAPLARGEASADVAERIGEGRVGIARRALSRQQPQHRQPTRRQPSAPRVRGWEGGFAACGAHRRRIEIGMYVSPSGECDACLTRRRRRRGRGAVLSGSLRFRFSFGRRSPRRMEQEEWWAACIVREIIVSTKYFASLSFETLSNRKRREFEKT